MRDRDSLLWCPGMAPESLPVDLADPADIRAKLPHARAILERREAALAEAQADVVSWRDLVAYLARRAGAGAGGDGPPSAEQDGSPETPESAAPSVQELVVSVINQGGPARPRDVRAVLHEAGYTLSSDSVSNALYYAAKVGKIKKSESVRGTYAPLSYRETLLLDSPNGAPSGDDGKQSLPHQGRKEPERVEDWASPPTGST